MTHGSLYEAKTLGITLLGMYETDHLGIALSDHGFGLSHKAIAQGQ